MQTLQAASPRRVLAELTPSRTNVLQLSFLKRTRTSSISNGTEISPQEEPISEKHSKRLKKSEVNIQYSNIEPVFHDNVHTCLSHNKHEENLIDIQSKEVFENNCANESADYTLNNGKCCDRFQLSGSQSLYVNKKILFEPFLLSKEQIKKYAHILKLRLRLAYYKLQINQPHLAFSALYLSLIPKRNKKESSSTKPSKTIVSKAAVSEMQLPSPISSQTHEVFSTCSYNNDNLVNTFNYSKYNIGLHSPPLSEERYCKNGHFLPNFTKND